MTDGQSTQNERMNHSTIDELTADFETQTDHFIIRVWLAWRQVALNLLQAFRFEIVL